MQPLVGAGDTAVWGLILHLDSPKVQEQVSYLRKWASGSMGNCYTGQVECLCGVRGGQSNLRLCVPFSLSPKFLEFSGWVEGFENSGASTPVELGGIGS